jgi:hypothetical protein
MDKMSNWCNHGGWFILALWNGPSRVRSTNDHSEFGKMCNVFMGGKISPNFNLENMIFTSTKHI